MVPKVSELSFLALFVIDVGNGYFLITQKCFSGNPKQISMDQPMTTSHYTNATLREKKPVPSLTIFERLSYDSNTNTSLVKCEPKTGRTHQIRRHLKMLGHCIVNDVHYNEQDFMDYDKILEDCVNEDKISKQDLSRNFEKQ